MNRRRIRRWCVTMTLALCALIPSIIVAGCTVAEARKASEAQREVVTKIRDVKTRLDDTLREAIEKGESVEVTIGLIRDALPPIWVDRFDRIIDSGRSWIDAALEISAAIDGSLEAATAELDRLDEILASKQDNADATVDLVMYGVSALLGGGVLAPIVGAVQSIRGRRRGAQDVARVVNAGMAADPELRLIVTGGNGSTTAHDAMKAALASLPRGVRDGVNEVKLGEAPTPSPRAKTSPAAAG